MKGKILNLIIAAGILGLASGAQAKIKEGQEFPQFNLMTFPASGKSVSLNALKGKVVVIDFWASWCEPCKVELPALDKLYAKYHAQGLEILGVNEDKEVGDAKTFLGQYKIRLPLLEDGIKGEVLAKLDVAGLPVTYLIGKNGKVVKIHKGFKEGDLEKFEKEIVGLMKSK